MSNLKFPSFNFLYTSSEDLRQFFVDYGRTGLVHVYKNGPKVECIPQKKEMNETIKVRLISEKPTLPLNLPGKISTELSHAFNMEQQTHSKGLWDWEEPVTNLTTDHGGVVFAGLAEVVGTEAAALSWCPPPTTLRNLTKFDPVLKRLETDFCDIPSGLLTDLVQESKGEEKVMVTGKYYGNCLAHARSTLATESDIVLVCPRGPTMSQLCFSRLEIDHEEERGSSVRLASRTGSFSLPEKICEVSMGNEIEQGGVIAVRTDHRCWFFGNQSSEGFEKPIFLGNLQCKTKPCAVTVSPYIPEEVIVAMETGSLWLWNAEDSSVEVIRQSSSCSHEEFDWYSSEFGSHPRQVVRGNQTNVELIDLRGGSSTSQDLMTLPSSHFFPNDKFTTIQRYHDNPYHYILATTQSLAILDTRFQQHPVLKWCHSLEYPVKYIDVLPDPTSADVLVFVGSYESRDVHCFQYCYGENWNSPLGMMDDLTSILPPRSTSNPWKISSYSEWPEMVEYPNKAQSYPKVTERLSQPLLGLSCIPTKTSLVVVQLSNTGDLFYQNLFPHESKLKEVGDEGSVQYYEDLDLDLTASGGCGSKKPNLGGNEQEFITKWVECLMEHVEKESKDTLGDLDENCDSKHVGIIREELFSCLAEIEVQCSLCSDGGLRGSSANSDRTTQVMNASGRSVDPAEICPYCKMSKELSDQIDMVRKADSQRRVLTKKCLGLNYEAGTLQLFDEGIQCSEPLGNVLLNNWYSDEAVPIDLSGKQNNETEEDKLDAVKTWLEKEQGESSQVTRDTTPVRNTHQNMDSTVRQASKNIKSPARKRNEDDEKREGKSPLKKKRLETSTNQHTAVKEKHVASPNVGELRNVNQELLSLETKKLSPNSTRSPKTPSKATVLNIASQSSSKIFGSPNLSQEPQVVSREETNAKNLRTPDKTTSQRGQRISQNTTPNLVEKSPRNPLSSPLATTGSQTRTPSKKKIARIPGF